MKKLIVGFFMALIFFLRADFVSAEGDVAQGSATLRSKSVEVGRDYRALKLKKFLASKGSPLTGYASFFIYFADQYGLDWRFIPAITGVESTFGKRIPKNSYNAYGWANGAYDFESWTHSMEIVARTLRTKYLDRGAKSIASIGKIYAPPSKTWSGKVKGIMRKIDPLPLDFTLEG